MMKLFFHLWSVLLDCVATEVTKAAHPFQKVQLYDKYVFITVSCDLAHSNCIGSGDAVAAHECEFRYCLLIDMAHTAGGALKRPFTFCGTS